MIWRDGERMARLSLGLFCAGLAAACNQAASSGGGGRGGSTIADGAVADGVSSTYQAAPNDTTSGGAGAMGSRDAAAPTNGFPADLGPSDAGPTNADVGGPGATVTGSGFAAQSGKPVSVALVDNDVAVARTSAVVTAAGTFEVVVPAALTPGHEYTVAYYVDANGNGICNAPPSDVSGSLPVTPTAAGARVAVAAPATSVAVCSFFGDFSYNFDSKGGLTEGHPNHNAYGVIADLVDNSIVGELKYGLVDAKGELVLRWPTVLLKGHRYYFVLWTDDNGDGVCGTDKKFIYKAAPHTGQDPINDSALDASAAPVTIDINETFFLHHETNQNGANICQMYFPNAHYP